MRKNFRTRESGASVLESTVCLLALTLAGFTAFEIAQWHVTRYLARLALHAAAREGAITGANPDARIFVRGDKSVSYGRIMEVMGTISAAGFNKVALVAELPHPDQRRP